MNTTAAGAPAPGATIDNRAEQPPPNYYVAPMPEQQQGSKTIEQIIDELSSPEALERSIRLGDAYAAAVLRLVTPADQQAEGSRVFKKKSAWRKLAQHFRISTALVSGQRWYEEDEDGEERHLIARVVVRATSPWGTVSEATGLCSTRESRFYASGIRCPACGGPVWDNRGPGKSRQGEDFKCKDTGCATLLMPGDWDEHDNARRPSEQARAKADHDVEATAETRATNRAISNLIAAGEVSAEEMEGAHEAAHGPTPILKQRAFGREWKGKTWEQVLAAGANGESFVQWAIDNADRMSAADKAELAKALAEVRSARSAGEDERRQASAAARQTSAQTERDIAAASMGEAAGERDLKEPPKPKRTEQHQFALVYISDNGQQLPPGLEVVSETEEEEINTDDFKNWIRKNWRALHDADAEGIAREAAWVLRDWLKENGKKQVGYFRDDREPDPMPTDEELRALAGDGRPATAPSTTTKRGPISEPQKKRLIALAVNQGGFTIGGLKAMVAAAGHKLDDIERDLYDELVEKAQNPDLAERYNEEAKEQE